jgi:hypothetical protein
MSINFNDIIIKNKIGTGMYGTVFLIKHNNNKYALKIQKVLKKDIKKDYKSEIWRELSFFKYINKLNNEDVKFFTKLYNYRFYNKCKHKQIREKKQKNKNIIKLDKSNWCFEYIIDYKGKETLSDFLSKKNVNEKIIFSFILQIINIVSILHKGGYSHDDIHLNNIMIHKTKDKYFNFNNKKIPTFNYQLVLIDYGFVRHNKFKKNKHSIKFKNKKNEWLFNHIFYNIIALCSNLEKYIFNCKKLKEKEPWNKNKDYYKNFFHNIFINNKEFWDNTKKKYIKLFPQSRKYFKLFEENTQNDLYTLFKTSNIAWNTFDRLRYEFQCTYPKLYSKYYGWCTYHKLAIKKNDFLKILSFKDLSQLTDLCQNKLKL